MDNIELTTLFQQIKSRWPTFTLPVKEALGQWQRDLAHMPYPVALWTIEEHMRASDKFLKLSHILTLARRCPHSRGEPWAEDKSYGYGGLWIECVEAPKGKPNYLGLQKPMLWGTNEKAARLTSDTKRLIATQKASRHNELYSGIWTVNHEGVNGTYTGSRERTDAGCPNPYQERAAT